MYSYVVECQNAICAHITRSLYEKYLHVGYCRGTLTDSWTHKRAVNRNTGVSMPETAMEQVKGASTTNSAFDHVLSIVGLPCMYLLPCRYTGATSPVRGFSLTQCRVPLDVALHSITVGKRNSISYCRGGRKEETTSMHQ